MPALLDVLLIDLETYVTQMVSSQIYHKSNSHKANNGAMMYYSMYSTINTLNIEGYYYSLPLTEGSILTGR